MRGANEDTPQMIDNAVHFTDDTALGKIESVTTIGDSFWSPFLDNHKTIFDDETGATITKKRTKYTSKKTGETTIYYKWYMVKQIDKKQYTVYIGTSDNFNLSALNKARKKLLKKINT